MRGKLTLLFVAAVLIFGLGVVAQSVAAPAAVPALRAATPSPTRTPQSSPEPGISLDHSLTLVSQGVRAEIHIPHITGATDSRVKTFNQEVMALVGKEVAWFQADVGEEPVPSVELSYTLSISYTVQTTAHGIVGILFQVETYTAGAAHPAHHSAVINYDLEGGKVLLLSDLFKPGARYLDAISDYCIQDLKKRGALEFPEGAEPKPENYRNWNIEPKGLLITFDEYQVAPYAAGPQTVFIPYATLQDIVNPDGPLAPFMPPPEPDAPVVAIIAPANDAQFSVGQVVGVQFTASDESGIARAELYVGSTRARSNDYPQRPKLIQNDTLEWTPSAAGNYTLKVIAYDASGNASDLAQRNIVVKQNVAPPTVRVDNPTQRVVIVVNQNIQVQTTVNDEVGIRGLDLVERRDGREIVYTSDPDQHSTPFTWQVYWHSTDVGDHTLFVRARDLNGGTGQSADFVIGVADNDPPRVQPSYSATALSPGSDLRVHVEAVDSKGVKELRLYVDNKVVGTWAAPDPSVGQSTVSTNLWWRNVGPAGVHFAHVWAVDTLGNQGQSPDQGIQVASTPPTPTPTRTPSPTPVPPTPSITPTQPPAPQATIESPANGFHVVQPHAVHFAIVASCGAWLDRVELWGYPQGQPTPQLYHTWPVGNSPSFTGEYDWVPPNAGVFFFYVRVHDVLGRHSQSGTINGYVDPPAQPTPVPTPSAPSAVGNWGTEAGDDGFMIAVTDHQGEALQGTFTLRPAQGEQQTVPIANSTIQGNKVTIHAQVGGVMYNFTLTLSADGQRMDGNWSTSRTGVPSPITFSRLVG